MAMKQSHYFVKKAKKYYTLHAFEVEKDDKGKTKYSTRLVQNLALIKNKKAAIENAKKIAKQNRMPLRLNNKVIQKVKLTKEEKQLEAIKSDVMPDRDGIYYKGRKIKDIGTGYAWHLLRTLNYADNGVEKALHKAIGKFYTLPVVLPKHFGEVDYNYDDVEVTCLGVSEGYYNGFTVIYNLYFITKEGYRLKVKSRKKYPTLIQNSTYRISFRVLEHTVFLNRQGVETYETRIGYFSLN